MRRVLRHAEDAVCSGRSGSACQQIMASLCSSGVRREVGRGRRPLDSFGALHDSTDIEQHGTLDLTEWNPGCFDHAALDLHNHAKRSTQVSRSAPGHLAHAPWGLDDFFVCSQIRQDVVTQALDVIHRLHIEADLVLEEAIARGGDVLDAPWVVQEYVVRNRVRGLGHARPSEQGGAGRSDADDGAVNVLADVDSVTDLEDRARQKSDASDDVGDRIFYAEGQRHAADAEETLSHAAATKAVQRVSLPSAPSLRSLLMSNPNPKHAIQYCEDGHLSIYARAMQGGARLLDAPKQC